LQTWHNLNKLEVSKLYSNRKEIDEDVHHTDLDVIPNGQYLPKNGNLQAN